jgi:hypothetical protein
LLDVEAGIREQIIARAHDIAQRRGLDLQFAETFLQIRLRVIRKARRFARPPGHIDPGIVDQEFEAAARCRRLPHDRGEVGGIDKAREHPIAHLRREQE